MTLKYESEILFDLMKRDGDDTPSDVLPYESELKEKYLEQVEGAYPKLQDYRSEWLNYNLYAHLPADFPVDSVANVTSASFHNVVPYAYGSAILKGNTLVNLCPHYTYSKTTSTNSWAAIGNFTYNLTIGKKYFICLKVSKNTFTDGGQSLYIDGDGKSQYGIINLTGKSGYVSSIFTDSVGAFRICCELTNITNQGEIEITDIMLIEYQDGMENWNIPYFEGMQSVKMPVLKTTGKNLIQQITFKTAGDRNISNETIKVTKGVTYTLSFSSGIINTALSLTRDNTSLPPIPTENESVVQNLIGFSNYNSVTFTTIETGEFYLHFRGNVTETKESLSNSNIQLEEGSSATSYEPYKSNILTVNGDVALRGIGEGSTRVGDELNCLTGEVKEHIGEIVLNGSEDWKQAFLKNNTMIFYSTVTKEYAKKFTNTNLGGHVNCDKFTWSSKNLGMGNDDIEGCYIAYDGNICIAIAKSKLTSNDVGGFKQYLQSNPTTVQYELETPIIKTVDLTVTDQDGNNESIIRPIEGTMHLSTSSDTIEPTFTGEVPVEATSQNLASFANIEEEE